MEYMNSRGVTVWLQAPLQRLEQRIRRNPSKRPLLAGLRGALLHERLEQMLAQRGPRYAQARLSFDSSLLENRAQIDATVGAFLPLLEKLNVENEESDIRL